jgi:hypothetical protein
VTDYIRPAAKWLCGGNAGLLRYPFKTGVFHRDFFKGWKFSLKQAIQPPKILKALIFCNHFSGLKDFSLRPFTPPSASRRQVARIGNSRLPPDDLPCRL